MKLVVHTQGIKGSGFRKPEETADALFGAALEIDGMLIERVTSININHHEGLAEVTVVLIPGQIEVVSHTKDSWDKLQLPGWIRPLA